MKHTEGPWIVSPDDYKSIEAKHSNGNIYELAKVAFFESMPETDANARLISAAPDLLQVAEKLREACENGAFAGCYTNYIGELFSQLNSAIAKAKSENSI